MRHPLTPQHISKVLHYCQTRGSCFLCPDKRTNYEICNLFSYRASDNASVDVLMKKARVKRLKKKLNKI